MNIARHGPLILLTLLLVIAQADVSGVLRCIMSLERAMIIIIIIIIIIIMMCGHSPDFFSVHVYLCTSC